MTDTNQPITPHVSPLDSEVFWMTRPDGVRVLLMKTHTSENCDNSEYEVGIVEMTTDMAEKLLKRIELIKQWKALDSMMWRSSFWNYEVEYRGWDFETECPTWEPDGDYSNRTETDRIEVTDSDVEWKCYIKHTDDTITCGPLYETDLRRFVAGETPWPTFEPITPAGDAE